MALGRVKVWVAGNILTAADLNAEFNNILNNPITLVSPTTGNINYANNQALSFKLENLGADPAAGNTGRVFYNTVSGSVKVDTGASIQNVGLASGGALGSYVRSVYGVISTNLGVFGITEALTRTTGGTASHLMGAGSFTIDTRTAGPIVNGRDQAAAFASTDVHWYVISTGDGATVPAGLVSSNPPAVGPVAMPTSYTEWAYLGASKYSTGTSGVVASHTQQGAWSYYDSLTAIVTVASSAGEQAISLASRIPQNSPRFDLDSNAQAVVNSTGTAAATFTLSALSGLVQFTGAAASGFAGLTPFNTVRWQDRIILPNLLQTVYAKNIPIAAAGTAMFLAVAGYCNPNGDV